MRQHQVESRSVLGLDKAHRARLASTAVRDASGYLYTLDSAGALDIHHRAVGLEDTVAVTGLRVLVAIREPAAGVTPHSIERVAAEQVLETRERPILIGEIIPDRREAECDFQLLEPHFNARKRDGVSGRPSGDDVDWASPRDAPPPSVPPGWVPGCRNGCN